LNEQVGELSKYNELRRYLSPNITERILSSGSDFNKISHRKLMTVFFSDIRGFSDLTDSLEPEEISFLLNNYLSEMTKLIPQDMRATLVQDNRGWNNGIFW